MSVQPFIAVTGANIDSAEILAILETKSRQRRLYESGAFVDDVDDDALAKIRLARQATDEAIEGLRLIFEELCEETNWSVDIDWDGLDDFSDFPYQSLSRPAGAKEPVLLWPDD